MQADPVPYFTVELILRMLPQESWIKACQPASLAVNTEDGFERIIQKGREDESTPSRFAHHK